MVCSQLRSLLIPKGATLSQLEAAAYLKHKGHFLAFTHLVVDTTLPLRILEIDHIRICEPTNGAWIDFGSRINQACSIVIHAKKVSRAEDLLLILSSKFRKPRLCKPLGSTFAIHLKNRFSNDSICEKIFTFCRITSGYFPSTKMGFANHPAAKFSLVLEASAWLKSVELRGSYQSTLMVMPTDPWKQCNYF